MSIHDFLPEHSDSLARLVDAVSARVGSQWHAAVPGLGWIRDRRAGRIARWCEASGEIQIHGHTHRRERGGPFSWLVDHCDEFAGANEERLVRRLVRGRSIIESETGRPLRGIVPPTWQMANLTRAGLRHAGLEYAATYWEASDGASNRLALNTWSWDCGRFALAGWSGNLSGVLSTLCRKANPHVVLHPRDAGRGFLVVGLRRIDLLLQAGFKPALFGECFDRMHRK